MKKGVYKSVKRIFDLLLALLLLLLFLPVMVVVGICLTIALKGLNVVFKQKRIGLNNAVFCVYKFKTMLELTDSNGALLSDKDRLFKFGIFLRKYSLDELPQIINVLNGTMSFIGPRPLLVEYLPRYNKTQLRRHNVRPGITGWAQVNGRNELSWDKKFDLDVWYVDNMSFKLDFKILIMTAFKIIKTEGISQPGNATMEKFMGND
jgi:sugar transferase EpsL